jgi:hypothetical protein
MHIRTVGVTVFAALTFTAALPATAGASAKHAKPPAACVTAINDYQQFAQYASELADIVSGMTS